MRHALLFLLFSGLVLMSGCAFLDGLAGLDSEGNVVGPNIADKAKPLAGLAGPWGELGVGALGLLSTLYASIRGRRYKKAALTGVRSIEEIIHLLDLEDGIDRDVIITAIKRLQEKEGTREEIKKLISKA